MKGTRMSTYFELSKTAQEQVLATLKQGQELALAGVELWASSISPLTKGQQVPAVFERRPRRTSSPTRSASPSSSSRRRRRSPRRSSPRRRRSSPRPPRSRSSDCALSVGRARDLPTGRLQRTRHVNATDDAWKDQLEALGSFIKGQRNLANLSLREMSRPDRCLQRLSESDRARTPPTFRAGAALGRRCAQSLGRDPPRTGGADRGGRRRRGSCRL